MMQEHPFNRSIIGRVTGILIALLTAAVLWGLLQLYTPLNVRVAAADSLLYTGLLAAGGYYGWYFLQQVRVWQARAGAFVVMQLACIGITGAALLLTGWEDAHTYLTALPLRVVPGILCWGLLFQWYDSLSVADETGDFSEMECPEQREYIDRISVKEGARIHLIRTDELIAIQAGGDYVTLITATGQHVKEQTMKHFERHLPASVFVRIHRSSIVNVNHILRVEQFGKDAYQVRLKNGITLRASATGYRLLRERLGL
ncbi:MAG: LytTR family transcriptional regulator DNA-binding domain-containing protein [Prevotellaceae bacterium]|jgi:hypothetical protein|nr:LytTR family transcriptional regulator DNA-binding domain-containing protein [Prevotellaceae bacterium]